MYLDVFADLDGTHGESGFLSCKLEIDKIFNGAMDGWGEINPDMNEKNEKKSCRKELGFSPRERCRGCFSDN
jgi:hypothetical protein